MVLGNRYGWLVVLGGFMLVSYIANIWASSATSPAMQYCGLSLYVVAEAVIFVPLLYLAQLASPDGDVIAIAGSPDADRLHWADGHCVLLPAPIFRSCAACCGWAAWSRWA